MDRRDEKDPLPVLVDATPLPPPSAPPLDSFNVATPIASTVIASAASVTNPTIPPPPPPPPSSATNNNDNATVVPPPFLIPTGTNLLSNVSIPINSKDWKGPPLSKLSKKCNVISPNDNSSQTKQLRKLQVPIEASEIVAYIYAKQGKNNHDNDAMAKHVENNTLVDLKIKRTYRSALLTRGSLQFKKLHFGSTSMTTTLFFDRDSGTPNVNVSLFDLRGVHVGSDNDNSNGSVVIVAFHHDETKTMRYVLYQTPNVSRFLVPLATALLSAYAARPLWSIPVSWTGNSNNNSNLHTARLPVITRERYAAWMGEDGGFSSAVYAAALAYHVKHKVVLGARLKKKDGGGGERAVAECVLEQQPKQERSFLLNGGPKAIDLGKLAETLSSGDVGSSASSVSSVVNQTEMRNALVLAGLRALSFNLVFRKLRLNGLTTEETHQIDFRSALGQALLYNVTLRGVDFESCALTGLGEVIGVAWAMNAQPLISRVNFSSCKLNGNDLKGLLQGLTRIWCGGTALAESIVMSNNPDIPTVTWDEFFLAFVDPTTYLNWPQKPPPPPNLSFLQELDVTGTNAIGPGMLQFASKLNGLRTLKLSANSDNDRFRLAELLTVLAKIGAPLERIVAYNLDASCNTALFAHCTSLKELVLHRFSGDAGALLCGWPQPVPTLSMTIGTGYSHSDSTWSSSTAKGIGYAPGNLTIFNFNNFGIDAMSAIKLCTYENGLKKLTVHDMRYLQFLSMAHILTKLESFCVYPPNCILADTLIMQKHVGFDRMEIFWATLAQSKTLLELQLPDQLIGGSDSNELAMIGRFLKSNRSVRRIGFDSRALLLKVEDVKVLRSAFYGNKKVTELEFLEKARKFTMEQVGKETKMLWDEVALCKSEIKILFKSAYSKNNRRWRDGPNRQKLPWVERIRVAKRRIGKIQRDQKKIATLLSEIQQCVSKNKLDQAIIENLKANERLLRREGQLKQLGEKKKKFAASLVAKLHKAKLRGRQHKSAKTQLPRSTYYKSQHMWPSNTPHNNQNGRPHSYYQHYNDPYSARHHWMYYPTYYHNPYGYHHGYNDFNNNNNAWMSGTEEDANRDAEANSGALGGMLCDVDGMTCEPDDPWSNVDALIQQVDSDYGTVVSPEYLALLHEECSELGPDVVENICGTLDNGAAISDKLDEIGEKTNAPPEMLGIIVDRDQFDLADMESTLVDIPEYSVDIMDAGGVVDMYAGAGPRDLDDGGPSFGGSRHAVLAGARRRAKARKARRLMSRVREDTNRRSQIGYQRVDLLPGNLQGVEESSENMWPSNLVESWVEEIQLEQVKAVAKCNLFDLPAVSSQPIISLARFSPDSYLRTNEIEVILVTQCSLDRLQNLKAQLTCWAGKSSVAIYLKPSECIVEAKVQIMSIIEEARNDVAETCDGHIQFDVAIAIVEGCMNGELYPINYLRNVALIEARGQHLRLHASLDQSAVLLVDVDFRPSAHLFKALHSQHAAKRILNEGKVIVCPAFESANETCVESLAGLEKLVGEGHAEGFHLSHFPQGHSPTQFERFWQKVMQCTEGDVSEYWAEAYDIKYEKLYEPYVVMASADVPLYDERFQGYGLNKVSHLATIASQKSGNFTVLPGVFLVAPAHERSDSWAKRYGTRSDEAAFNQLELKGLYYNFTNGLESGRDPVISSYTRSQYTLQMERIKMLEEKHDEFVFTLTNPLGNTEKSVICY